MSTQLSLRAGRHPLTSLAWLRTLRSCQALTPNRRLHALHNSRRSISAQIGIGSGAASTRWRGRDGDPQQQHRQTLGGQSHDQSCIAQRWRGGLDAAVGLWVVQSESVRDLQWSIASSVQRLTVIGHPAKPVGRTQSGGTCLTALVGPCPGLPARLPAWMSCSNCLRTPLSSYYFNSFGRSLPFLLQQSCQPACSPLC